MYATHFTPPTDAEKAPEYQMTYLGAWALTGSREQFQHGAAAFRNGRDWAKERRGEFISIATTKKGSSSLESTRYSRPSEFGKSASLGILKLLLTSLPFRQLWCPIPVRTQLIGSNLQRRKAHSLKKTPGFKDIRGGGGRHPRIQKWRRFVEENEVLTEPCWMRTWCNNTFGTIAPWLSTIRPLLYIFLVFHVHNQITNKLSA